MVAASTAASTRSRTARSYWLARRVDSRIVSGQPVEPCRTQSGTGVPGAQRHADLAGVPVDQPAQRRRDVGVRRRQRGVQRLLGQRPVERDVAGPAQQRRARVQHRRVVGPRRVEAADEVRVGDLLRPRDVQRLGHPAQPLHVARVGRRERAQDADARPRPSGGQPPSRSAARSARSSPPRAAAGGTPAPSGPRRSSTSWSGSGRLTPPRCCSRAWRSSPTSRSSPKTGSARPASRSACTPSYDSFARLRTIARSTRTVGALTGVVDVDRPQQRRPVPVGQQRARGLGDRRRMQRDLAPRRRTTSRRGGAPPRRPRRRAARTPRRRRSRSAPGSRSPGARCAAPGRGPATSRDRS